MTDDSTATGPVDREADTLYPLNATRPAPVPPGYDAIGVLGRGGMGVVYEARQTHLGRTVALKLMLGGSAADAADVARFRGEAHAMAQVEHPNVVQVYEVGDSDGSPYLAMEFCRGGSLAGHLDGTPWPPTAAAALVAAVARGVDAAHQFGIVHRDLKPANILIQPSFSRSGGNSKNQEPNSKSELNSDWKLDFGSWNFTPKVCDFGLAKRVDAPGLTVTGVVLGTPSYMPPEQARRGGAAPTADVYALGAVLYELLTGRPPFRGANDIDTLIQLHTLDPIPPRSVVPNVPADLETVCLKCLQKDPARRYPTAAALSDDLQRFLAGDGVLARPASAVERAWRWCRRHPTTAGLSACLLLLLAGAAALATGVALLQNRNNRELSRLLEYEHAVAAREAAAREQAERNRILTAAELQFFEDLFADTDPLGLAGRAFGVVRPAEQIGPVKELVDRGLERLRGQTSWPAESRGRLLAKIGTVYLNRFNDADTAEQLLTEALALIPAQPPSEDRVAALQALGFVDFVRDRTGEAVAALSEALAARESLSGPDHAKTAEALFLLSLPLIREYNGQLPEERQARARGTALLRRAVVIQKAKAAELPTRPRATTLLILAFALQSDGQAVAASAVMAECLQLLGRDPDTAPTVPMLQAFMRGEALRAVRSYTAAVAAYRDGVRRAGELFGERHFLTVFARALLASVLVNDAGRPAEAEVEITAILDDCRRFFGRHSRQVVRFHLLLARCRIDQGLVRTIGPMLDEAECLTAGRTGDRWLWLWADLDRYRGMLELGQSRPERALQLARSARAMRARLYGADSSHVLRCHVDAADALFDLGRDAEAMTEVAELVRIAQAIGWMKKGVSAADPPRWAAEAAAARSAGRTAEAAALYERAVLAWSGRASADRAVFPPLELPVARWTVALMECERERGRFAEARRWWPRLLALERRSERPWMDVRIASVLAGAAGSEVEAEAAVIRLLRRAFAAWPPAADQVGDPAFAPLRSRWEFTRLVWDVAEIGR